MFSLMFGATRAMSDPVILRNTGNERDDQFGRGRQRRGTGETARVMLK
jgi:hypothetical protein